MLNTINEEIVHINGQPQKLVIFLHGYIDNADRLEQIITPFIKNLNDTAIHLPQASISCEVLEDKRQWYSMHRFDPEDERKTVHSMEECVSIYDKMTLGLEEARCYLDEYIDNCLNEYQLSEKDLYLCGFSQGAMLAIYTALMRENKIAGCVSFGGIMAGHSYLLKHARTSPDFLLMHGADDNLVRPEAIDFTKNKLIELGCEVESKMFSGVGHRVTEEGLLLAGNFIEKSKPLKKKIAI